MAIDPITDLSSPAVALDGRAAAPNRADALKALVSQFESMLISQMLREMQSDANTSNGENYGGALSDTMYGELSRVLASAGGLGLSTSLEDAIARTTPGMTGVTGAANVNDPAEVTRANDAFADGHVLPRPFSPWMLGPAPAVAIDRDRVTSAYGVRRDPFTGEAREHKGIDIPAALGDDIRSVKSGTVIESGTNGGYGNTIVVDHGDGVTTRYAHLSSLDVAVGDRVKAGQLLGLAGRTGRATGTHLHLEVRQNGVALDPLGPAAERLLGRVATGIERKSVSADDTHGASR